MSQPLPSRIELLRGADLVPSPWKNGGGVTREIVAFPQAGASLNTFAWRASLADIAQDGPFSRFADIDRTLVLASGAGLLLDEGRVAEPASRLSHALALTGDVVRFGGESAVDARLVDGPVSVFNLMVRRGAVRGGLQVWREAGCRTVAAQTVLLHAAHGPLEVNVAGAGFVGLATGDTLRVDSAGAVPIESLGDGVLLVVALDT
jgi:uncharacterized protein